MGAGRVHYADGDLLAEIRPRVVAALAEHERSARSRARAWLDVALAAAWFFATYAVLVFVSLPTWALALAIVSMGLALTASLTNVVHPLMHRSVGRSPRLNVVAAQVLAPFGVSWRWWVVKHNVGHHGSPGVAGRDPDADQAPLLRFDRSDPWQPWHRFQHVYAWFVYSFFTLRLLLFSDVPFIITGREKGRSIEPPSVRRTAVLLLDKLGPAALLLFPAFVRYPAVDVVAVVFAAILVNGLSTVLLFLPGHQADERPLSVPDRDGRLATDFASTIFGGTINTRVRNPVGRWFMSGLDHHIEHHMFPWVSHRLLHVIAPFVEEAARARGLPYLTHASVVEGWRGHFRRLQTLGRPTLAPRAGSAFVLERAVEDLDRLVLPDAETQVPATQSAR
jgi:linoleoyl-CoA desaturase